MRQNKSQIFRYNGSPITFNNGDSVMVNATEMAKPFGKLPAGWLRNQATQDFITELAAMRNCIPSELVKVTNGDGGGTWMHEDVAMEFARWLSPKFAIWCNDRIKELLTKGTTSIAQLSRKELALMVVQAEEENERLLNTNEQQKGIIALQKQQLTAAAPKVNYYDETLQSVCTMTTTQVAKELGLDAHKLNKRLKEVGIIFRQSGMWMLKHPYSTWDMAATRTQTFTRSDGSIGTSSYTVWKERGRCFLHVLHKNNYNVKKACRMISGK